MSTPMRRRPGRPPKAEAGDTKAALLKAALELFARHGFAGTSIRAIAREVGMSESVLYAHFPNKQAMFEAVLGLGGPRATVDAIESLDMGSDPAAYIRELASAVMTAWNTPEARQLASLAARDGLMHHPLLSSGIDEALAHLAGVFQRWLDEGRIRDDLGSAGDLAYGLLAPIAHARMLWLHSDATPVQRKDARSRAVRHAELIARAVVPATSTMEP
jgi:AcrR family transcriptional regulator